MKTLITAAGGMVSLLVTGVSLAQNGNMMNGGMRDLADVVHMRFLV